MILRQKFKDGVKDFLDRFLKRGTSINFQLLQRKASLKIARKLVLELTHEVIKLQSQPYTGQKEELLIDKVQ